MDLITELLKIHLLGNDFLFEDKYFFQIKGTAMGKSLPPPMLISTSLFGKKKLSVNVPKKTIVFFRYLDDIFGIWEHSETEF